ncbi:DUF6507 family protein [Nocardiopsis potens]|uniref:DUF6507 family protein n=1 Tax=Nocardiopsis potens TaxID=1246458 RepID=UPI00034D7689|nr:DUF6507 family protein [Nocardiopsis potens]
MSKWDIDAPGVQGVLNAVVAVLGESEGEGLGGALQKAGDGLVDSAANAVSFPIESALYKYVEEYGGRAEKMAGRAASALGGCADAVNAYLTGDLEMAEEAQSNAGTVESDLPTTSKGSEQLM